jgi:lipoprotein NlpD
MLEKRLILLILLIVVVFLPSCGTHLHHVVERGETLYSISWQYGYDYREIAHWNGVKSPYVIKEGQILSLVSPKGAKIEKRSSYRKKETKTKLRDRVLKGNLSKSDKHNETVVRTNGKKRKSNPKKALQWQWPTRGGKLIQTFDSSDPGKSGLDIGGRHGQSVFTVSSGRVVYSGGGLPRYGKLVIVKHNEVYLSAYAHNKDLLVKEGDWVKAGQVIARMGDSGTSKVKLHFEIRRNGRAINPLRVLPKRMP